MAFRLHRAAASFQCITDKALKDVQDCTVAYIDDTVVFSPTWEAHLRRMFQAFQLAWLTNNRKKSHTDCTTIQYLGFWIGQGQMWAITNKLEDVDRAEPHPPTHHDKENLAMLPGPDPKRRTNTSHWQA